MKTRILLAVVVVLGWSACAHADTIYDAAADFSATSNPNGVWSYGFCVSIQGPSQFHAFTNPEGWYGVANLPAWDSYAPFGVIPADPAVFRNVSAASITKSGYTIPAGALALDSYGNSNAVSTMVRWTAPSAGTVNVSAAFKDGATGAQKAYVFDNGTALFNALAPSTGVSYAGTLTVAAGDKIDFLVGAYGGSRSVTILNATVAMVPEPATLALLGTGLIGLLAYAWKKQR